MTKNELLDFYNHRDCDGWLTYYRYLNDEDKKVLEEIDAEETVKKWRADGTLINRISWFSQDYKKRYGPYIERQEFEEAHLYSVLAEKIFLLHSTLEHKEDMKKEILRMRQDQKALAAKFLNKIKDNSDNKDFVEEINFAISCLDEV